MSEQPFGGMPEHLVRDLSVKASRDAFEFFNKQLAQYFDFAKLLGHEAPANFAHTMVIGAYTRALHAALVIVSDHGAPMTPREAVLKAFTILEKEAEERKRQNG